MSPSATNPALTQSGDYPNFFRTIASDDAQARLEVDFALDVLKVKKLPSCTTRAITAKAWPNSPKAFLEKDSRAEVVL
jgi:branched-chain amino acid transport system substrate-binding protein